MYLFMPIRMHEETLLCGSSPPGRELVGDKLGGPLGHLSVVKPLIWAAQGALSSTYLP